MRNWAVNWANGMFLRPQHFQAAERYWHERNHVSESWDHAYNYGLRSISLSEEAIGNQHVDVSACKARLRDGTLIDMEIGEEPDRVKMNEQVFEQVKASLESAFEKVATVMVYLAVPKLTLGRANLVTDDAEDPRRWRVAAIPVPDENLGGNDQEISHRAPDVRVLLETDDTNGYELLPIAKVKRTGDANSVPQLDESYIPPVLTIDAWPQLGRDIIRSIYDRLGENVRSLAINVKNRGMATITHDPRDLQRVLMLSVLNEAYSVMRCLTFAAGIHPYIAYVELCRIVGSMSIFGSERALDEEIPIYDHDDLAYVFNWLKRRIFELVDIPADNFEQKPFIGAFFGQRGPGMAVQLERRWFTEEWDWYVGVLPTNLDERECRELLEPGMLNWKMGSQDQVDWLFRNNARGVDLDPVRQVPHPLPPINVGWVYYRVEQQGPAWNNVRLTNSLGLRFAEQYIDNLEQLEGKEELAVYSGGKKAGLRFTLFAVRRSST